MPQEPTPASPIVSFPTPQIVDRVLVEEVDTRVPDYRVLQPGERHPKVGEYPDYVFVKQQPSRADKWIQRFYVNDRSNQDTYNADIDYSGEAEDFPIYRRTYLERRLGYTRHLDLSRLTGVVGVQMTAGGSGYTSAPTVEFTHAEGAGATAIAIIFRGAVVGVVITAQGSDYIVTPPTVAFTGGGGSGATATARIQPYGARLVKERVLRLEGDPVDSLYVRVERTYETLPGPSIIEWEDEPRTGQQIQITKTIVAAAETVPANHAALPAAVNGQITEYPALDKLRSIQIVSKIPGTPPAEKIYSGIEQHSFPNVLTAAPIVYAFYYQIGSAFAMDFATNLNIREGYSGPCNARITERYTFDPTDAAFQAALPGITPFNPQAHVVQFGIYVNNNGNPQVNAISVQIPETLHPSYPVVIQWVGGGSGGEAGAIPATLPTGLPLGGRGSGNFIVKDIVPEKWRFGLWIYRIIEIEIPAWA